MVLNNIKLELVKMKFKIMFEKLKYWHGISTKTVLELVIRNADRLYYFEERCI